MKEQEKVPDSDVDVKKEDTDSTPPLNPEEVGYSDEGPVILKPGSALPLEDRVTWNLKQLWYATNKEAFIEYIEGIPNQQRSVHLKENYKRLKSIDKQVRRTRKAPPTRNEFHKHLGPNSPCPCGKINPNTGKPTKWKKCCRDFVPKSFTNEELAARIQHQRQQMAKIKKEKENAKSEINGKISKVQDDGEDREES